MFHGRHLFRRETAPAFIVPDWDIGAGFSPRRHCWSRRRAGDASDGWPMRVSVKTAIELAARACLLMVAGNPHGRAGFDKLQRSARRLKEAREARGM
jgi:hypothetical protein